MCTFWRIKIRAGGWGLGAESREPRAESRELGAGSWELGAESWELGASSASSAFRYNAYRPCAPRMAHLSIQGCTCCVPASVVSKVADKQSTAKSWEPAAQVRPFGITRTAALRMAHLSIHGCTCCVPASVVSKVADKQSTAKC